MQVSPRVNAGLVGQYINRPVRVVGTVQGYDENKTTMSLLASDGGLVQVILALQNQGMAWEIGAVVEVIGQAQGNQQPTLQEYTSIPFSKDFSQSDTRERGREEGGSGQRSVGAHQQQQRADMGEGGERRSCDGGCDDDGAPSPPSPACSPRARVLTRSARNLSCAAPFSPVPPTAPLPDLANYDKLVQLMNGKHQALFM